MAGAIAQLSKDTGKPPLVFSLCEWGEVRTEESPLSRRQIDLYVRNNPGSGRDASDKAGVYVHSLSFSPVWILMSFDRRLVMSVSSLSYAYDFN